MSSRTPLIQLRRLDRTSSTFHDQVSNILYGEEYKEWVQTVQGDDLVALVDHLDKVRYLSIFFVPRSTHRRLLILSTLLAPLSGSVCANSDTYAAQARYCHFPVRFHLNL